MKFSKRHDIDAPIEFVFERATDFGGFERQALRRGIQVERLGDAATEDVGMKWDAAFTFRGKKRKMVAELTDLDPPHFMMIQSNSTGIKADFDVEFLPLSPTRTRIKIGLEMLPKTLPARLMVQSLKFAKSSLDQRFAKGVDRFCKDLEERYQNAGKA